MAIILGFYTIGFASAFSDDLVFLVKRKKEQEGGCVCVGGGVREGREGGREKEGERGGESE